MVGTRRGVKEDWYGRAVHAPAGAWTDRTNSPGDSTPRPDNEELRTRLKQHWHSGIAGVRVSVLAARPKGLPAAGVSLLPGGREACTCFGTARVTASYTSVKYLLFCTISDAPCRVPAESKQEMLILSPREPRTAALSDTVCEVATGRLPAHSRL